MGILVTVRIELVDHFFPVSGVCVSVQTEVTLVLTPLPETKFIKRFTKVFDFAPHYIKVWGILSLFVMEVYKPLPPKI